MKLAFVTDSGTGFSKEYWQERGIYSLPLQIGIGNETYEENETISYSQIIDQLHQQAVMKTSLPSLGQIEDLFEDLKAKGYEGVFCVPIAKGLSGTLHALESAAQQVGLAFYGVDVYTTAVIQAHCIVLAKKMYEEGHSIEEILETLEKIAASGETILLCDDLQHMKRGGRLTASAAMLGGLLKIKPILIEDKNTKGKVDVLDKVRTMSRAQDRVISYLKEKGIHDNYDFTVAHVDSLAEAQKYAQKILQTFPNAKIRIIDLVSAVGIHTGLKCLAIQVFDPQGQPVDVYENAQVIPA